MRKIILSVIALLFPLSLLMTWVLIEENRIPAWQPDLNSYIGYKSSLLSKSTTVQFVDRARKPYNFREHMSGAVYGETPYYITDYGDSGPRPMPYPPLKVWCILLESAPPATGEGAGSSIYTVVFIAEHHDLYNADMMVHEPAFDLTDDSFEKSLSEIGCDALLEHLQLANSLP